jgi:predicted Zn-dependent protease
VREVKARPLAALLVALAAGSVGSAEAAGKEIDSVASATFEFGPMAIGQAKDLDYARAEGLGIVPGMPLDAYLNGVLAKLLAGSPVTKIPARVYVRASGDWAARSTADANIYLSLGILLRLDSEDEVAALLAHEASHVILGHANSDAVQRAQQRAVQLSALAVDAQRAYADARGKTTTNDSALNERARIDEQSRVLLLNSALLSPSWTRGQERDADRLGVDLMVRAGYSPQGMVSLLQKQKAFETERAASPQASALDQQLLGFDATDRGQQQIDKVQAKLGKQGELFGALASAALKGTKELVDKQLDQGGRSHPKTKERIGDVEEYLAKQYGDFDAPQPDVESWEAAKDADGTVDVLENYIAAIEAKGKLADGDVAAARPLAKSALTGPTKAHAYPNYVDASVQIAGGAASQAMADYDAALAGPEPAGAIYTGISALYFADGQADKAVAVIEQGYARLQEPPSLAVPLIRAYRKAGRQGDADRLAAQCGLRWPSMQSLCSAEAKGP